MKNYIKTHWDSELIIQSDVDYDPSSLLNSIEDGLESSKDNTRHKILDKSIERDIVYVLGLETYNKFVSYEGGNDATGLLKGYALARMRHDLTYKHNSKSFAISFGGDILVHNKYTKVRVTDKFSINLTNGCVFTSNNEKRPDHIKVDQSHDELYDSVTVVGNDPIRCDYLATSAYAHGKAEDTYGCKILWTKGDYPTLVGYKTYCASPFFCDEDRKIRDDMIKPFELANIFRPDMTDASKSYDVSPGEELSKIIYQENVDNIESSDFILFPKRTSDLGTLYEVGHALSPKCNKSIISYDNLDGMYEMISNAKSVEDLEKSLGGEYIGKTIAVNLNSPGNAILLGYLSNYNSSVYYRIPEGKHDNIMLANTFSRIDKDNNLMEKDYADID